MTSPDHAALADVRVSLTHDASGTVVDTQTDERGEFAFSGLAPGSWSLSATAAGFGEGRLSLPLEPREVRTATVIMEIRRFEATVRVTADAARLTSTHSPSSTVIDGSRLEALPASLQQHLPEAVVSAAPGMIRGHDDFVHVRGHEVALNPIINGVSFRENPHGLFSAGLSPSIIDTVNVMTGGFPAEYGNRFGGVLDIVTRSGLRMQNDGTVTVTGGDAGRRHLAAEFGGHGSRIGYYAFGTMFASDRFFSPPAPDAIHDSARGGRGFVQVDGSLASAGLVRVTLMGDGANAELPIHARDVELRPDAGGAQRTRQQSAIVSWAKSASQTAVSASAYQRWSRTWLVPSTDPLAAHASLDRELLTAGAKADVTRFSGRHAIKAGVDGTMLWPSEDLSYDYSGFNSFTHLMEWPHLHVTGSTIAFAGRETGGQVSAYVQDTIQAAALTIDAGLRLDHYSLGISATELSPRVNVAWRARGTTVLHASYNRFFVPPPVEGVLSSNAGLTANIREVGLGLPAIEPTTEHQVEAGAAQGLGPLQMALTAYYRHSHNPVHTTVWPDSRIYSYAAFDRARAYGLEARLELPVLVRYGVNGYLNYAAGRVYFYNPVRGGFVTEAGHLNDTTRFLAPMDQTHTLTTGLTYRHARSGAWIGTMLEYGSGTPMGHGSAPHDHADGDDHSHASGASTAARVPGHLTASLSVGLDLLRDARGRGRLSVQADAENVGNDIFLIAQEGEFSPAQYSIPRLISIGVRVRF